MKNSLKKENSKKENLPELSLVESGETYHYPGDELSLFQHATNWKSYFARLIKPYLSGDILEVGAGCGGTTPLLFNENVQSWTCLEPDLALFKILNSSISQFEGQQKIKTINYGLDGLETDKKYDVILYIDVLEHIEDDKSEMQKAFAKLNDGGHIIILSPAHNLLFSPFDEQVGHYRRYNRSSLQSAIPDQTHQVCLNYLDSVGFFASLANKILLKQSNPSASQIKVWDSYLVPLSKIFDQLLAYQFGKSILGI